MSDTEQINAIPKPKRVYKPRVKKEVIIQRNPEPMHEPMHEPIPEPMHEPIHEDVATLPKKRERSEKQILAFKKMQEKRKEQDELKKLNKSIEKDKQIHDTHSTKIQKLKEKIITNAATLLENGIEDSDEEEPIRKKSIPKNVYEHDEEEVIARRRYNTEDTEPQRRKKSKKQVYEHDEEEVISKRLYNNEDSKPPRRKISKKQVYEHDVSSPENKVSNEVKYIFV